MEIVIVGDLAPTPEQNTRGPMWVTYHICKTLSKKHNLTAIVRSYGDLDNVFRKSYHEFDVISINIAKIFKGNLKFFGRKLLEHLYFSKKINDVLSRLEYDVINSHTLIIPDIIRSTDRIVLTFHGAETKKVLGLDKSIKDKMEVNVYYLIKKRAANKVKRVTAVSKKLRNEILGFYRVDAEVIYNGIDKNLIIKNKNRDPPKDGYVLCVGYIHEIKNQEFLIKNTPKKYIDKMRFVGEILDKNYYNKMIVKYGNGIKKYFLGPLPKKQLLKLYDTARVCVIASHSENFPLVGLESLARGLPLLAKENTGITEIIKDGRNGFVFDDEIEYRRKLTILMEDNNIWKSISKNAIKTAKKFIWDRIVEDYIKVYKKVINR